MTLGLALGLSTSRDAAAFCRSTTCDETKTDCKRDDQDCKTVGKPLFWASSCVGFSTQNRPSRDVSAADISRVFDRSLAAWSSLPCTDAEQATFSYARMPTSTCPVGQSASGPNANVLVFRDDDWPYQGIGNTLGYTTVTFSTTTGEIYGADIEVNSAYNIITTSETKVQYDLQSILTHELGHALGLGHSADPEATMSAYYATGTIGMRSLAPDDISAACLVYEPGRKAKCDTTPRGGFAASCDPPEPDFGSSSGCALGGTAPRVCAAGGAVSVALAALAALGLRRGRSRGTPRKAS